MTADLENPSSKLFIGRIPNRSAVNRRSGVKFGFLMSPRMKAKSQLPRSFRKRFSKGSEKFLSIDIPLIGLEFEDKTVLPIHPGPHQFLFDPTVTE